MEKLALGKKGLDVSAIGLGITLLDSARDLDRRACITVSKLYGHAR